MPSNPQFEMDSTTTLDPYESCQTDVDLIEFSSEEIQKPDESKSWEHFYLGEGGFAKVYEIRIHQADSQKPPKAAALKQLNLNRFSIDESIRNNQLNKLKREANLISQLRHMNIVELYGVCYDGDCFGIVLELCEGYSLGSLCRNFSKERSIPVRVLTNWALQIAVAMEYLVSRNYLHRDLKADNVLIKEPVCYCANSSKIPDEWCGVCKKRPFNKLRLKITDFGLTKSQTSAAKTLVGTIAWVAPEILNKKDSGFSKWTEFSDVWSFGVLLWELLARDLPHSKAFRSDQTLILNQNWPWNSLMEKCQKLNPQERPTFRSAVKFFEDYEDDGKESGYCSFDSEESGQQKMKKKKGWVGKCLSPSEMIERSRLLSSNQLKCSNSTETSKSYCCYFAMGLSLLLLIVSIILLLNWYWSLSKCSYGYSYYPHTNFCYKAFVSPVSFEEADRKCHNDNGFLISIHSQRENNFISTLYLSAKSGSKPNAVWQGLAYDDYSRTWSYTDDTKLDYINWNMTENIGDKFWTILMLDEYHKHNGVGAKWRIVNSSTKADFVCKKKPNEVEKHSKQEEILQKCPIGYSWFAFTDYCYKVSKTVASFEEADEECIENDSHLISVHSPQENNFISLLYARKMREYKQQPGFVWLGLTYDLSLQKWIYTDGTEREYYNFNTSEDMNGRLWNVMLLGDPYKQDGVGAQWTIVFPATIAHFICKKKTNEIRKRAGVKCPTGFKFFSATSSCYKISMPPVSFDEAENFCDLDHAQLTSIHSVEENNFLSNLYISNLKDFRAKHGVMTEKSPVWIGIMFNSVIQNYDNLDGTKREYSNWKFSEHITNEYWAVLSPEGPNKKTSASWRIAGPDVKASVICKLPGKQKISTVTTTTVATETFSSISTTIECSEGYQGFDDTGFCYKIQFEPLTFEKSTEKCNADGAHLASTHSPEEHEFIVNFYRNSLRRTFNNTWYIKETHIWTGLVYNEDTKNWTWTDGSEVDFQNWKDRNDSKPFVITHLTLGNTYNPEQDKWKTVGSSNFFASVCKKPDVSHPPLNISIVPQKAEKTEIIEKIHPKSANCSRRFTYLPATGYCYKSSREKMTFDEANKICEAENSSLTSIHSDAENRFVIDLAKKAFLKENQGEFFNIWIGFVFKNDEWVNVDGTPVDYTNWINLEPNFLASEFYTSITLHIFPETNKKGEKWNNQPDFIENAFVCKKSPQ